MFREIARNHGTNLFLFFLGQESNNLVVSRQPLYRPCRIGFTLAVLHAQTIGQRERRLVAINRRRRHSFSFWRIGSSTRPKPLFQKGSENPLYKPHKTNSRISRIRLFLKVWVQIQALEN